MPARSAWAPVASTSRLWPSTPGPSCIFMQSSSRDERPLLPRTESSVAGLTRDMAIPGARTTATNLDSRGGGGQGCRHGEQPESSAHPRKEPPLRAAWGSKIKRPGTGADWVCCAWWLAVDVVGRPAGQFRWQREDGPATPAGSRQRRDHWQRNRRWNRAAGLGSGRAQSHQ